ncbi:MAG: hypothetical protein AAFN93_07735 [Bacteroidota bacterium]
MKKLIKPSSLLFYFLSVIMSFFIGLLLAKVLGAGKGQMLAGGAIVLFYGIISAGVGFIASIFLAYELKTAVIIQLNKILGLLLVVIISWGSYKLSTREKDGGATKENQPQPTKPVSDAISLVNFNSNKKKIVESQPTDGVLGLGFFKPKYFEYPTLYFYGNVNLEKSLSEHLPIDSVGFTKGEYGALSTSYAPPWLLPEHLKMDYGIIFFKVTGIGEDFLKVETNKSNNRFAYLDKRQGAFLTWPEFLLAVNSIEFNELSEKKVRIKPLSFASEVNQDFEFMRPLLIENDWMYVQLMNDNFQGIGNGWIQWKKGNTLLVDYYLLS